MTDAQRLTVLATTDRRGQPVVLVDATALRPGQAATFSVVYELANGRRRTDTIRVLPGGPMQPKVVSKT